MQYIFLHIYMARPTLCFETSTTIWEILCFLKCPDILKQVIIKYRYSIPFEEALILYVEIRFQPGTLNKSKYMRILIHSLSCRNITFIYSLTQECICVLSTIFADIIRPEEHLFCSQCDSAKERKCMLAGLILKEKKAVIKILHIIKWES